MNCLFDECTARNKKQKKKKCCLFMGAGKENENGARLGPPGGLLDFVLVNWYYINSGKTNDW